jgi:hypothetical protein
VITAIAAADEPESARVSVKSDGTTFGTTVTVDGKPLDLIRAEWSCDASSPVPTLVLYVDGLSVNVDIDATSALVRVVDE